MGAKLCCAHSRENRNNHELRKTGDGLQNILTQIIREAIVPTAIKS